MSGATGLGMVGQSRSIRELRALIATIAPSGLPVLVEGPTGCGKELVARALHSASGRRGPFVAVNVCAIAGSMLEAALFGHVKGAFTGATRDVQGYLAEADGGTLLLDEISGLEPALQPKLLRAIETREFRPIGARTDRVGGFRLVAATNEDLASLVSDGRFRLDLLARLGAVTIAVPPLAERLDDIPDLVSHFAPGRELTAAAIQLLKARAWPGNVRELRHATEYAALRFPNGSLGVSEMQAVLRGNRPWMASTSGVDFTRRRLEEVLSDVKWETAAAAALLGVHRATVYRWMERLGIAARRHGKSAPLARLRANSHPFAANELGASPEGSAQV